MTLKLAISQPYVPAYRVPFFSRLVDALAENDIECTVVASSPAGDQKFRGDSSHEHPWIQDAHGRTAHIGGRSVEFFGAAKNWADADALITGLLGTSPDLYWELLKKPVSRRRLGVWGHVKSFVTDGNRVDLGLEVIQMKAADRVFAYTPAGRDYAIDRGISPAKITVVMNSVDADPLRTTYEMLDDESVRNFADENSLHFGKTFGYIGGLDASKRVDILSASLDRLWGIDRQIKVVVGGRGNQEHLLSRHIERGQVVHVGYANEFYKAMIARVSEALLNPGRVGLLAVECLALGIPLLTLDWEYHAPEYEYLCPDVSVFKSVDNANEFAELVLRFIRDGDGDRVPKGRPSWPYPTIDDMVENYKSGVLSMLA